MSSLFVEVTQKSKAKRAELDRNTALRREAAAKVEFQQNAARACAVLDSTAQVAVLAK